MSENILIGVAWPYANGSLHLGHVAGAYLPADIFARYHRMKGNNVLMVSGSDEHGTPITIRAEQEKTTPAAVADKYHREFVDCFERLGITFDLFTSTGTANHAAQAQEIFSKLLEKGYIFKSSMLQPYCPNDKRFLPDRYVEGLCPFCKAPARGDQCDSCGKPLNPNELVNVACKICGAKPEFRETEHFILKLSAFQDALTEWAGKQKHWRSNVYNLTQRYLNEGLQDRAITRDIDWGIPVPLKGYDGKVLYVWFEAVIGYLSASKEWAQSTGNPDAWRPFWEGDGKGYYFIGKDNIPFHTLIWPAIEKGYGGINLPFDVPANEFLTFEGQKGSKSKNWAVWVPDYLSRYDPDPIRYMLSVNMPETSDTDFSWHEFVRRNNDELVATYGNLVNRVLSFTYKNFEGSVPQPGDIDDAGKTLLGKAETTLAEVDRHIAACHFRDAIKASLALSQEANRYLDEKAPWKAIKVDKSAAGTSLYVAICVISALHTAFYPFLPFSSARVHDMLGFDGTIQQDGWTLRTPAPGQKLREPKPLFIKLEKEVADAEAARLGQANG